MNFESSTGTVEIVMTVNGTEKTYRCGRHELPKEVGFFRAFENVEIIMVRNTETKDIIDWEASALDDEFDDVA